MLDIVKFVPEKSLLGFSEDLVEVMKEWVAFSDMLLSAVVEEFGESHDSRDVCAYVEW